MSSAGTRPQHAVTAAVGAVVTGVLPVFLTASLARRMQLGYAFGPATLGLAVALFHGVSASVAPTWGRVVGRTGPRAVLRASVVISALAMLAIALWCKSAFVLLTFLAIAGIGNGGAGPAASALLKETVAARRRGLAFGAQQAGAPAGVLLAGVALPLVAIPYGWRAAFVAAVLIALLTLLATPPRRGAPRSPGRSAVKVPAAAPPGLQPIHLLAIAAACANAAGTGVMAFLVLFATGSGMSEGAAGVLLSLVSLAAILGRLGVGFGIDLRGVDALRVAIPLLVACVAGTLLLVTAQPALIVVGSLIVGGLGWAWPAPFTLASVSRNPDRPAWAVGVMMSGLFSGAVVGPLLVGALAERASYAAAWIGCAALAGLSAVFVVAAMRRYQRDAAALAPSNQEDAAALAPSNQADAAALARGHRESPDEQHDDGHDEHDEREREPGNGSPEAPAYGPVVSA